MSTPAASAPRSMPRRQPTVLLLALLLLALLVPPTAVSSASSYELEARYDVDLHLDWDTRRVSVKTTIDL